MSLRKGSVGLWILTYTYCFFVSEHQNATTLDLVGEQVWRGALFLADFILHYSDIFRGKHVLEVASGVGLTSVVAAMLATKVTVTGGIINSFAFIKQCF